MPIIITYNYLCVIVQLTSFPPSAVVGEIEERRAFLEQMESLGQGSVYRTQIRTEISQRVRMLEVIDQKRSADLAALEAQQDK